MAGEIEFLEPEPTPGHDEVLPGPARHREHRPRLIALVAGVALIGIGFVARVATGGSDSAAPPPAPVSAAHPSPSPISVATSSPGLTLRRSGFDVYCDSIPVDVIVKASKGGRTIVLSPSGFNVKPPTSVSGLTTCSASDSPCPEGDDGQSQCTSTTALPATVLQAVQARYPQASVRKSSTEIVRPTQLIWYRGLTFEAGLTTITVVVEQPGVDPGPAGTADNGSQVVSRAVMTGPSHNVVVVVTSPSGTKPDTSLPQQLADDDRLVAVS